jgi:hypothetical protein
MIPVGNASDLYFVLFRGVRRIEMSIVSAMYECIKCTCTIYILYLIKRNISMRETNWRNDGCVDDVAF